MPKKFTKEFLLSNPFSKSTKKNSEEFDLSLGNIIFSRIYLNTKNFNKSVEIFQHFLIRKTRFIILQMERIYTLCDKKQWRNYKNEEEIVSKPGILIEDIYLLKKIIK